MAIYKNKGLWNIDLSKVKANDEFIMCNLSQLEPSTTILPNIKLFFKHCNLARVTIQPEWVVEDSLVTNEPIPSEPTEEEMVELEAEALCNSLKELAYRDNGKFSKEVSRASKRVFTPEGMQNILSADENPAEVKDLSGKWK